MCFVCIGAPNLSRVYIYVRTEVYALFTRASICVGYQTTKYIQKTSASHYFNYAPRLN